MAADVCRREGAVDVLHHAVELTVRFEPPSLTGRGELRLRSRQATRVISLDAQDVAISEVSAQGEPLRFQQSGATLCIELRRSIAKDLELPVKLSWQARSDNKALHFSADQLWAGYQTSAWMPTLRDSSQRATLALRVNAPRGLKVAASGNRVRLTDGQPPAQEAGLELHAFELTRATPPFLYAFAVGRFDEAELPLEGFTLRALGPPGSDLTHVLSVTAPMYRSLSERIAAPLPTREYVQVFVHGDAAQEAAGMALLGEEAISGVITDPTDDWIFSHELSHQWFAWLVPCTDFADFWLNEGFATFLVASVKEQRWGRDAYEKELERWRRSSANVHANQRDAPVSLSRPGLPLRAPPSDSELQARGVTYSRGALVLDKLRTELGDSAFWAGIRRYATDRAGKGARTEDLRAALEAASGRSLAEFFDRWVYSAAPDL